MGKRMNSSTLARTSRKVGSDFPVSIGLAAVILFFVVSGALSYWNTKILSRDALLVTHTHEVITALGTLESLMKDTETGQRGYVITGDEKYLTPYQAGVDHIGDVLADIERMTRDNPRQQERLPAIKAHIKKKLDELDETIELRRARGFEEARAVVLTDRGKGEMDIIRSKIGEMKEIEAGLRKARFEEMNSAYRLAILLGIFAGILGVSLSVTVAALVRRSNRARRREEWLQTGQVGLSSAMFGEQRVEQLGDSILTFLADYLDAHAAAFFIRDGSIYRRVALYGVPAESRTPEKFGLEDGLLGQAAKEGKTFLMRDVPEGYLTIGSALGQGNPRQLVIAPAITDEVVNAVIELGFVHPVDELSQELLQRVGETIAIAVKSANYRAHLQNLLEETQRQAEELQAQSEELRVNNEELEEQSRALKESQARLEQQQAELEQTNAQLEEQAQLLEGQRDDLSKAKSAVQLKAQELERASQYKSDFLANMSHELRTPLNSSLILAKLLADNPKGNLTEEQVKFAQTIQGAGNDLLMLINDILDLSKIEAGHMDVRPETVSFERLLADMTRQFEPMAKQKGLNFKTEIGKGSPETVETDRQRLEQILKNMLSNAIKFTEKGGVLLHIGLAAKDRVVFSVTDTGIGIAPEQQQQIFEAFRQADSTISRKYGGTGLGLSISRELARLLGGSIDLKSEFGKGSSFMLTIPKTYDPALVVPRNNLSVADLVEDRKTDIAAVARRQSTARTLPRRIDDDRENLTGNSRVILVVEDDEPFAKILYNMAHELNFQCLVATTAEEALIVAKQYAPSAVVLDVGLPDNSGLTVLDRLKHDARTRHIPVHVISANDYAQTALSLGAVGYLLKPVKRDQLVETLKSFEAKLEQRMRRVLIVEDDAVQRDSMRKLLGSHEVETVAVGTAAECLEKLKDATFDCMVLDLSLPDASGYQLLETLSREDSYSFPPVIVYTGRELSADEEQKLRRYSKSIIIKGVKSPERLLDEVTLFLHQVVADLPPEQQKMIEKAHNRDAVLENRHILVVEDDVRNIYALTNILEPRGAVIYIARNGREALETLEKKKREIDLVLMDVMMPEMDGMTATREIRKKKEWEKLPVIMLTAKAMRDDQERCLAAGANDYMAKPLDVEKLLSLVRVWMPR
jgi:CheY-like chemotaxis protein/CHASE3 domain sensor protein